MATSALRIQTLLLSMSSSIGTGGRTMCRICRKLARILPVSDTFLPDMYSHQTNISGMKAKHVIFDASTNIFIWMEAIGLFEAGQILLRHWWLDCCPLHPGLISSCSQERNTFAILELTRQLWAGQEHDCGLLTPQQLPLLRLCYVPCTVHNKNTDYFVTVDPQQHQVQRLHRPPSWANSLPLHCNVHRKAFLHFVTPGKAWPRGGVH
ncbi:hypothetical protein MUK42_30191 [Musa troglodytarum]|uniref:Uncharacterized protein n=1 Tax=Musa troglodytarum TaxID=320322 RepID=A0A9E7FS11_9LILI|nr:hypothetical protein MUK42_30191 [Musa troglodytarum]